MLRLFQSSFGEATSSYFFRVTYSTQQLLSWSSYFFRAAAFLRSSFFRTIIFFEADTSAQHACFQKSYISEKANFSEKQYSALPTFSGKLRFWSSYFFKRGYLLWQLSFQKSYFLRHTFSEQLHFLLISF